MANLIPADEMTELKPASDVKTVADEAIAIHEEQAVAALINQAANAGQHRVTYSQQISDELLTKLEDKGYTVTANEWAADPAKSYVISGF